MGNRNVAFWVLLVTLPSASCASMQVSKAKAQLEAALNPLLGKSKNEVLLAIGAPQSTRFIADMEVWDYYRSYGVRSRQSAFVNTNATANTNGYVYPGGYNAHTNYNSNSAGFGSGQAWEAYDQFTLYFTSSNTLAKWDGYVQR